MSSNNNHNTDVVIIGAGPVGLFAAFEAGMLNMKSHIVDILEYAGGQCTALYPEKPIYDIPAYPEISGQDLIAKLQAQIAPFDPVFHLNNQVTHITKNNDSGEWKVETNRGVVINCKAVIIAAGCGAFGPHKPPIENLAEFEETKSVQYFVPKIANFAGKEVVIAGGGDSAIDWVLSLVKVAKKISLIHRRDKFRAAPASLKQMRDLVEQGKIDLIVPYQLHQLSGNNGNLTHVLVKDLDNNIKEIAADVLLPFYGLSMDLGAIFDWGLELEKKHIVVEPATMRTNLDGVFAIGDIASYAGKLKLILTGFSEAAIAAHQSYKYVYPDKALHFEYSTSKGVS